MNSNLRVKQSWGRRVALAFGVTVLSLSAYASAQTTMVPVKHAQGQTEVPANPQKTVVFDMPSLDTLNTLGVKASAVPTTPLPDYLAGYQEDAIPKVGTLFEPDYEAVHAAEPDLIIVGGRSAPKYRDLSKLAPTIDLTVDPQDVLGSVARNARTLGQIYGKQDQAEALVAKVDEAVAEVKAKTANMGPGLIVLTVGGKMSAYGPGSRFGLLHDVLGIPAAVKDLATSNHGQAISFEFIFKTDPEWLFVIDRDAAIGREGTSAKQLLDNELIHKTTAWKKDQVVYLNSMNWYLMGSAGPTALLQNIDQISKALDGQK